MECFIMHTFTLVVHCPISFVIAHWLRLLRIQNTLSKESNGCHSHARAHSTHYHSFNGRTRKKTQKKDPNAVCFTFETSQIKHKMKLQTKAKYIWKFLLAVPKRYAFRIEESQSVQLNWFANCPFRLEFPKRAKTWIANCIVRFE